MGNNLDKYLDKYIFISTLTQLHTFPPGHQRHSATRACAASPAKGSTVPLSKPLHKFRKVFSCRQVSSSSVARHTCHKTSSVHLGHTSSRGSLPRAACYAPLLALTGTVTLCTYYPDNQHGHNDLLTRRSRCPDNT